MQYGMNSPCMVCSQKSNTLKLHQLQRLLNELQGIVKEDLREYNYRFNWHNHTNCRYGLHCNDLSQYDRRCDSICEELSPFIEYVCKTNNEELYHRIYNICRGDYPQVCRDMEMLKRNSAI